MPARLQSAECPTDPNRSSEAETLADANLAKSASKVHPHERDGGGQVTLRPRQRGSSRNVIQSKIGASCGNGDLVTVTQR